MCGIAYIPCTVKTGDTYYETYFMTFGSGAYVEAKPSFPVLVEGTLPLVYGSYLSDKDTDGKGSYHVYYLGQPDENSENATAVMVSDKDSSRPLGVAVTGGTGTADDPFSFRCLHVSSDSIKADTIYRVGGTVSFGSGTYVQIIPNLPGEYSSPFILKGNASLVYHDFISTQETGGQGSYHRFSLITEDDSGKTEISLYIGDTNDSVPIGIRLSRGKGSESDPIIFKCVHSNDNAGSGNSADETSETEPVSDGTSEDNSPDETATEDDAAAENAAEDNAIDESDTEDNAAAESATEDNAAAESTIEDGAIDERATEDSAIDESAAKDDSEITDTDSEVGGYSDENSDEDELSGADPGDISVDGSTAVTNTDGNPGTGVDDTASAVGFQAVFAGIAYLFRKKRS